MIFRPRSQCRQTLAEPHDAAAIALRNRQFPEVNSSRVRQNVNENDQGTSNADTSERSASVDEHSLVQTDGISNGQSDLLDSGSVELMAATATDDSTVSASP